MDRGATLLCLAPTCDIKRKTLPVSSSRGASSMLTLQSCFAQHVSTPVVSGLQTERRHVSQRFPCSSQIHAPQYTHIATPSLSSVQYKHNKVVTPRSLFGLSMLRGGFNLTYYQHVTSGVRLAVLGFSLSTSSSVEKFLWCLGGEVFLGCWRFWVSPYPVKP